VVTGESDDTDGDIDTDFGNLRTAFVDLSAVTLAATDGDQALYVLAMVRWMSLRVLRLHRRLLVLPTMITWKLTHMMEILIPLT